MNTRVELKVCEGCGALWLRKMGAGSQSERASGGTYCPGCSVRLSDFPAPRGRHRRRKGGVSRTAAARCGGGER